MKEELIKSKQRVQMHGEVFTPRTIVKEMLDVPEINEACDNIDSTFLEPAAGEGAFMTAILKRKLDMVAQKYNEDLNEYENYSLLALSTIYGIELLEDNAQTCVMNMFQQYYVNYQEQVKVHNGIMREKVLSSAKKIISLNLGNGNFLTRKSINGSQLVFSKWEPIGLNDSTKHIKIQRTEYTLDEIYQNVTKENGHVINQSVRDPIQLDLFSFSEIEFEEQENNLKIMSFIPVKIIDVFKEEMAEVNG